MDGFMFSAPFMIFLLYAARSSSGEGPPQLPVEKVLSSSNPHATTGTEEAVPYLLKLAADILGQQKTSGSPTASLHEEDASGLSGRGKLKDGDFSGSDESAQNEFNSHTQSGNAEEDVTFHHDRGGHADMNASNSEQSLFSVPQESSLLVGESPEYSHDAVAQETDGNRKNSSPYERDVWVEWKPMGSSVKQNLFFSPPQESFTNGVAAAFSQYFFKPLISFVAPMIMSPLKLLFAPTERPVDNSAYAETANIVCCGDCSTDDAYCQANCREYGCHPVDGCIASGTGAYAAFCRYRCSNDSLERQSAISSYLPFEECRGLCVSEVQKMCRLNSCTDYGCFVDECANAASNVCAEKPHQNADHAPTRGIIV